jgi:phosphate acyltransferase
MKEIRIAVDAMGGDDIPHMPVAGACLAARTLGVSIALVGRADLIEQELARLDVSPPPGLISIVDTPEWIEMGESPSTALRAKKAASVLVAAGMVAKGEAQAMVSAGNSGAAMGAAVLKMKTLPGIERPAIAIMLPTLKGEVIFLDAGATVDCQPKHLFQFAQMGSAFARSRFKLDSPRVGLLSIGEEASKGNSLTRAAHDLLAQNGLNFVGNIEPKEMLRGAVEVAVCDGFVGNISLKIIEGIGELVFGLFGEEPGEAFTDQTLQAALNNIKRKLDWAEHGGALLLGVKGLCIISHGRSTANALAKAIQVAKEAVESRVIAALA